MIHLHVPEQAGALILTCLVMTRVGAAVAAHLLVTGQAGPRVCTCMAVGWSSAALTLQLNHRWVCPWLCTCFHTKDSGMGCLYLLTACL